VNLLIKIANPFGLSRECVVLLLLAAFLSPVAAAQARRKVIIDQDAAGPGGTDMQSILSLINSQDTEVLGIAVLTGDGWRDEEVQHTLRLLEIIGRTDIPVLPGAAFPLVNSKEYIAKWETLYGKVIYQGAWGMRFTGRTKFLPCRKARPRSSHLPKTPRIS
jgi:purine nucleosidase